MKQIIRIQLHLCFQVIEISRPNVKSVIVSTKDAQKISKGLDFSELFMSDDEFKSIFLNLFYHKGLNYNTIAVIAMENFKSVNRGDKKIIS
jgi:hypothetical protein